MTSNYQESMYLGTRPSENTNTEGRNVGENLPAAPGMSGDTETASPRPSPRGRPSPRPSTNLPDDDKTERLALAQMESSLNHEVKTDTGAPDIVNRHRPPSDMSVETGSPPSNLNSDDDKAGLGMLGLQCESSLDHEINSNVDASDSMPMNEHGESCLMPNLEKNDNVLEQGFDSSSGSGLCHESNSKSEDSTYRVKKGGDNGSSDEDEHADLLTAEDKVEDGGESSDSSTSSSDSEIFMRHVGRKRPSKANTDADEKVTAHVLFKEKPKHKWFVVQEVVNRQKGVSSRHQGSDVFRQRCYGSLHSVQRLELMYKLESHEGCVNTIHFNIAGTLLASGSDDLQIVIWNWAAGQPLVKYDSGHRSNVFQAKFLPLSCNTHVVSCSRDGQVRLAELSSTGVCRSTRKLGFHRGPVHKLAVQTETPHVFLSCGEDAVVMSNDVREQKPNTLVLVKDDERKVALYGIHSNPMNNNEFCLNGRNNFIRIYDKRLATVPVKKFCPQHLVSTRSFTQVTSAMFNYNGTEILGSYNDEDIYLFDTSLTEDADYVHKYEGHRNNVTVKGVNFFGPKSEYIVSGSDCGNIFFWDKHTEAIVQWMPGDENGVVNCLEPHPQIPVIATSGLDSDVKIWVPSCEKEPSLDGLKEVVVSNYIDRENENHRQPDSIDSQMLMMLWRHMRRSERRKQERAAQNGAGARSCGQSAPRQQSTSDSSDSDDDNDTTFEQCTPS